MNAVSVPEQAVILVGGRGTRLGALTDGMPKPLCPIAGRPFLDWQLDEVARFGFARILLLAGYKGDQIIDRYHGRIIRGAHVEVVVEPEPMGTGGALKHFAEKLAPWFLLLNGDTLFEINLLDLPSHLGHAVGVLALRRTAPGGRFGTVSLQQDGTISGFAAGPTASGGPINGGIYALSRRITDWVGDGMVSLEQQVFPRLAAAGLLRGYLYDGRFIDIGIPEDLERGQREIVEIATRPAAFLDRDGVLIHDTHYPHDPKAVSWVEGAASAIRRLNEAGFLVFVVTNQAGVARGFYDETAVNRLHHWMADQIAPLGAHVDAFEYCPHHPDAPLPAYRCDCRRRKPAPGMIEDLLAAWPVDRARSFLIGDKQSDVEAAAAAGLPGYLFAGGSLDHFVDQLIEPHRLTTV